MNCGEAAVIATLIKSHYAFVFFTPSLLSAHGSGWCERGLRGCGQLFMVAVELQTLRQLQVPHTEKRGLQPHAVCEGKLSCEVWPVTKAY